MDKTSYRAKTLGKINFSLEVVMRQVLNHIYKAQMAHSCSNWDKLRIELENAAKLAEEKLKSPNTAKVTIQPCSNKECNYYDCKTYANKCLRYLDVKMNNCKNYMAEQ